MNRLTRIVAAGNILVGVACNSGEKEAPPKPTEQERIMAQHEEALEQALEEAGFPADVSLEALKDSTRIDQSQTAVRNALGSTCEGFDERTKNRGRELVVSGPMEQLDQACERDALSLTPDVAEKGDAFYLFDSPDGNLQFVDLVVQTLKSGEPVPSDQRVIVVDRALYKDPVALAEALLKDKVVHTFKPLDDEVMVSIDFKPQLDLNADQEAAMFHIVDDLRDSLAREFDPNKVKSYETSEFQQAIHTGRYGGGAPGWVEWSLGGEVFRAKSTEHSFTYEASALEEKEEGKRQKTPFKAVVNSEGGVNFMNGEGKALHESGDTHYPLSMTRYSVERDDFTTGVVMKSIVQSEGKMHLLTFNPWTSEHVEIKQAGHTTMVGSIEGWYPIEWYKGQGVVRLARVDDPETKISMKDFIRDEMWVRKGGASK